MSFFSPGLIEPLLFDRFQNLLWSRKTFVDHMKVYNHSYIYMPAFSMKTGTEPSLRVYYTLSDVGANQTVLFANPNFLRSIGKFWMKEDLKKKFKTINKVAIKTYILIITLNVNGLITPTKRQRLTECERVNS